MKSHTLEAVFDRLDGDSVVLIIANQELRWPKKQFPKDVKIGQHVHLELHTTETLNANQDKLAKSILNEILKDEDADNK